MLRCSLVGVGLNFVTRTAEGFAIFISISLIIRGCLSTQNTLNQIETKLKANITYFLVSTFP